VPHPFLIAFAYTGSVRRILILNTDLEIGGTPTVVRELSTRLGHASRAHIEVACLGRWGPIADQIAAAGVPVTALGAKGPADLLVLRKLIRLIRGHRIDTVFSFLVHANAMAAAASLACRDVRFIQAIQTTQPNPRWHWRVQALAQSAAERIVAPSESVAQCARDWADVPAEKIVVIPNALDRDDPVFSLGARAPLTPRATPTIGFIGRLDPIKRLPDLVQAMSCFSEVRLDIFGDGEQRAELETMIAELQLGQRVHLRGPSNGPAEALQQIDLLVLPSAAEGFPLVLIEAMAARVPIVATDAPGIRDVVQHERTALLVPVGHPTALAAAIESMLNVPARRQRLVDAAHEDVLRRFTWDRGLPSYLELLGLEAVVQKSTDAQT
jgi:glycosyltransferase involved in cell wall biosynthesis